MLDLLLTLLPAFFVYVARCAGLVAAVPGFSATNVPARYRVIAAATIALCLLLSLGPPDIGDETGLLLAIPMELLVGLLLGFTVRLMLATVEVAGEFLSFQMGYAAAAAFDPTSGSTAAPPTRFFFMVTLVLFFAIGGHLQVIAALGHSYTAVPAGGVELAQLDPTGFLAVAGGLFEAALQLAFPFILVMLAINVALAFVARVLPQMNVFILGFALTLSLGLVAMAELMPHVAAAIIRTLESVPDMMLGVLG